MIKAIVIIGFIAVVVFITVAVLKPSTAANPYDYSGVTDCLILQQSKSQLEGSIEAGGYNEMKQLDLEATVARMNELGCK